MALKIVLLRHDVKKEDITVIWVPGAYEIPLIAKKQLHLVALMQLFVLGAVIRGAKLIMTMYVMKWQRYCSCFFGNRYSCYVRCSNY